MQFLAGLPEEAQESVRGRTTSAYVEGMNSAILPVRRLFPIPAILLFIFQFMKIIAKITKQANKAVEDNKSLPPRLEKENKEAAVFGLNIDSSQIVVLRDERAVSIQRF